MKAWSKQWVLRRQRNYDCDKEQTQMPAGNELHTEGASTLKLREAKVFWTQGTDNRLVLGERSYEESGGKQAERSWDC